VSPRQPDFTDAVEHLKRADPKLAMLIERVGPCTRVIPHHFSIFYSLMRSIMYQQLAGKAAATICGRVERACAGGKRPTPEQVMATSDEALRAAGLSRNKLAAIRDLAAKTLDGTVPDLKTIHRLSDEVIIERLIEVRGIGRWTAEMLLMFRLGRPDVLPCDDYGVRKGAQLTYKLRKLPDKKRLTKLAGPWRPHRSIGSWYMWRALDIKTVADD
jgi:3-methyladenine DNA glycosylase/8-oxoguanine DNA glycosylase